VDFKIFMDSKSIFGGTVDVYDVGAEHAPIKWDGIVNEWLKDDDIGEIVLTSPNIGFTKRLQKVPLDFDVEEYKKRIEIDLLNPGEVPESYGQLAIDLPMIIVDDIIKTLINARANAQRLGVLNEATIESDGIDRILQLIREVYGDDEANAERLKLYLLDRRGDADDIPRFKGGTNWAYDLNGDKVDAITKEPLSKERLAEIERDDKGYFVPAGEVTDNSLLTFDQIKAPNGWRIVPRSVVEVVREGDLVWSNIHQLFRETKDLDVYVREYEAVARKIES